MSSSTTHTQSSLSRAWTWSVERSPLLNAARWILARGYPNTKARDLINAADLPAQLSKLIDSTITKTKLWRSERADIARELIAHTQDALEAERTPEQITEAFGNPKRVAKLLRRATKRKRPLYWRTLRNIRRSITTLTLLIFLTYGSLAARFYIGKPNITKNYAVMINAQNDAYTDDQKAWPIYKEVFPAWRAHIQETQDRQVAFEKEHNESIEPGKGAAISAGLFMYPQIPTDHHDYTETVQLFKDFEPQFKRLREAAHCPIVGIQLGFKHKQIEGQDWSNSTPLIPPSDDPNKNPSMINMLLPHLGPMRQFANILAFETLIAARESDSDRTYENLSAMLAISRQESFDKTLISSLVNMAIANVAFKSIHQVLHEYPGVLTRDHLIALSHELALTRPALDLMLEGEIMMFEDLFQRAYTDDGHGNGRITKSGMLMFAKYADNNWSGSELEGTPLQIATGPITLAVSPDRESQATIYMDMMNTVRHVASTGPESISLINHQDSEMYANMKSIPGLLYSPVEILMPAMGHAISTSFFAQMNSSAIATTLAIEIYKMDHGQLPDSLSQLTPNYLPSLPSDLFNPGQPLSYKQTDNGYTIYSVGNDGDDDHGRDLGTKQHQEHLFRQRFPAAKTAQGNIILDHAGNPKLAPPRGEDGDWIIYDMTPPSKPTKKRTGREVRFLNSIS